MYPPNDKRSPIPADTNAFLAIATRRKSPAEERYKKPATPNPIIERIPAIDNKKLRIFVNVSIIGFVESSGPAQTTNGKQRKRKWKTRRKYLFFIPKEKEEEKISSHIF